MDRNLSVLGTNYLLEVPKQITCTERGVMARMLIKSYPNYNGCRPGVCVWQCETPKPYEVKKRRRIARRKEEREWKREIY